MKTIKNIDVQFPKDDSNELFDGRIHSITPTDLESFFIGDSKIYILRYKEENQTGITLLGEDKNGVFFKIPLDNYDELFYYLDNVVIQEESLALLNNQDYINTMEVQNAEQLFSNGYLDNKLIVASSTNGSSPPTPFYWQIDMPETVQAKTISQEHLDNPSNNVNYEIEREKTLYIGCYGSEFAVYRAMNRSEKQVKDNKFRFRRNKENKKLRLKIEEIVHGGYRSQGLDEIYIDYGEGEKAYDVCADLINFTDIIDNDRFDIISGKTKYKLIISEFINDEDFKNFKSSILIECTATDDMNMRIYPETHDTIFLALASSNVIAKFEDSYQDTTVNSFARKLEEGVHQGK